MRRTGERAQRILWLQLAATNRWDTPCGRGHPSHRQTDPPARPGDPAPWRGRVRRRHPGRRAGGLKYLGSRLDWLRQRLIELEQQKRLFLRHVSHELKTPLTALREGSELLAEGTAGPLSLGQREIVEFCSKRACNCSS